MAPPAGNRRLPIVAAGTFFVGYLLFQIVYPMLPWFLPGYDRFTWQMYSGRNSEPLFAVVFADGSRREVGDPIKIGARVRLLGASVDQRRVLPPWLCASWEGAESIVMRSRVDGREVVVPCREVGR
jgi:hypothetical protein